MDFNRTYFRKVYDCGIVLRILMVIILALSINAAAETLTVCPINCPYSSIQTAINDSTTGDTIAVQSGVYYEHVNITKRLTLRGSTVPAKPQIIAGGSGSAIMLSVNGIILDGFIATNGNEGIRVISSDNTIKNNSALNNVVGIHLVSSKNNTLSGNNANSNTQIGISLDSSHNNILSKNAAISNTGGSAGNFGTGGSVYGIYLNSSTGNTLKNNSANLNTGGSAGRGSKGGSGYGIYLSSSIDNSLNDNTANSNTGGSVGDSDMGGTSYGGSGYGIYLTSSIGNTLNSNTANSNTGGYAGAAGYGGSGYGIYLTSSIGNTLNSNSLNLNLGGSAGPFGHVGNGYGIYFISYSSSNTMIENNVSSNGNYNIALSSSSENLLYHNNLYNSNNAYDNSANSWDNGAEGNYYSDYKGKDENNDSIGDSPYPISGGSNVDHYPLMKPYNPPPTSIENLSTRDIGTTWLNFTWLNPPDPDYHHVILFLNGAFLTNVTLPQNYYNVTGLTSDTEYELGTHTVDSSGNVNETWVNATTRTLPSEAMPPVAVCGADKLVCENVGAPVQFNASASYDPDGTIISYYWEFGDGTNGTGMAPNHIYAIYRWNGTAYLPFIVNLTVTDDSGLTNRTSQKVVIWAAGDTNGDANVNILDASLVGLKWKGNEPCADLNNDGKVNIVDASIIGLNWVSVQACRSNLYCSPGSYCEKKTGNCAGNGTCQKRPDSCTDLYDPVCGCNGITYSNACYAAANGVSVAYKGVC